MATTPMPAELQELFRLADQAGVAVLHFDADLDVVAANEAAHAVLDRPPGGLLGRSSMEALLDHRLEELLHAAIAGEPGDHESERGPGRHIMARARPSAAGGAWLWLEDVTELRRLQQIRREFFDNVSHELRTPLANIRLLTEMLLNELPAAAAPDEQRIRERVATIDVESGHLAQMIDELLDLSRMEQGNAETRHDAVALPGLVEAAIGRLQTFADRQGVTIETNVPADLPLVRGDEEQLATLLRNLLHNAIKFSPGGGSVTVMADEHPESVVVSVADQGVGIPVADQEHVFERFYKVDRARHRGQGGTGLGLAIAQTIAVAHGGDIWLESVEGDGSTFSFSLSLA